MISSNPNHLPKASPANNIILGVRASTQAFCGGTFKPEHTISSLRKHLRLQRFVLHTAQSLQGHEEKACRRECTLSFLVSFS